VVGVDRAAVFVITSSPAVTPRDEPPPRLRTAFAGPGMSRPERMEQTIRLASHPVPDELWTVLTDLTPAEENWLR
jgi:hypothetical protein